MLDNTISTRCSLPMAISLAFGVLLGTLVTLFLVPCLYLALEDIIALRDKSRLNPTRMRSTRVIR